MQLQLKHYVSISSRDKASIAKEIGVSKQVIGNWLVRDTPVFVTFNPDEIQIIEKVANEKVIYERK